MKSKLKDKLSSYGFWVSILSVIFLLVKQILAKYGIDIDNNMGVEIVTAICYALIVFGVISTTGTNKTFSDIKKEVFSEIEEKSSSEEEKNAEEEK